MNPATPALSPHEGSWVVTHLPSGKTREFFRDERDYVDRFAGHTDYRVDTIIDYLTMTQPK